MQTRKRLEGGVQRREEQGKLHRYVRGLGSNWGVQKGFARISWGAEQLELKSRLRK
jgi:hypothetical protein